MSTSTEDQDKIKLLNKNEINLRKKIDIFMKDLCDSIRGKKIGADKKANTNEMITLLKNEVFKNLENVNVKVKDEGKDRVYIEVKDKVKNKGRVRDKELVKVLEQYVCDRDKMSILHLAAIYEDNGTLIEELLDMCPELITKKRNGEYEGQTALHIVIMKKNFKGAEAIINTMKCRLDELKEEDAKCCLPPSKRKGIEHQRKDFHKLIHTKATGTIFKNTKMIGELPLSTAVLNFDQPMIKLLLDNGAKIRKRNSRGDTVFHTLVRYAQLYPEQLEQVKDILKRMNAELRIRASTQVDSVDQIKEWKMAVWFRKNKEGLTVLQLAALLEQPEIFAFILDLKNVYRKQNKCDGLFNFSSYDITEIDSVAYQQWRSSIVTVNKVTPISGLPEDSQEIQDSKRKDKKHKKNHESRTILSRGPRSSSVLEIICESKTVDKAFNIITLPVLKNIIDRKWKWYLPIFIISLIMHGILMTLVTAQTMFKAQLILPSNSIEPFPAYVVTRRLLVSSISIALFLYGVILIVLETVRIWHREPLCLTLHHHNGLYRLQLIVLALSMMGDSIWYWAKNIDNYYLLLLALVIGWWYFTFYLRPFKMFSFFTVMMRKVLFGDALRFSTMIIIDLLAFSFAMYATFLPSPNGVPAAFEHLGVTIMTMFKLFLGLIELDVLYEAPQHWLAVVLFVTFTVMTYILMMNALIAMMSSTCSTVADTREEHWQLQRLSVILMIEGIMPYCWRFNSEDEKQTTKGHILHRRMALHEGRSFMKITEPSSKDTKKPKTKENVITDNNQEQASSEDVTKKGPQRQISRNSSSDDNTQARPPSGSKRRGSNESHNCCNNKEQASPEDVTKKGPQRQTSRTSSSDDNTKARPPSGSERRGSNALHKITEPETKEPRMKDKSVQTDIDSQELIFRERMVPNLSHDTEPDVTSI